MISLRKYVLQNFIKSCRCFATFTNRENDFKKYFEGKIISQYAEHISKYKKIEVPDNLEKKYINNIINIEDNVRINDLPKIIHQLQLEYPSKKFIASINALDVYFTKNLMNLDGQDLLTILDSLMEVIPSKITKLNCFQGMICRLIQTPQKPEDFIRICFYAGLCKKKKEMRVMLSELFDKNLDVILETKISSLDFAIICNSAFKSVVPITSQKFKQRLILEVIQGDLNPLTFLTFIKSIRLNKIKTEEVIDTIRKMTLQKKFEKVSLCETVHVLALLADNLVRDDEITSYFVKKTLCLMDSEQRIREKDIATFLWCCSHLNLDIAEVDLQKIVSLIFNKIKNQEYRRKFDKLVDSVLSLWILNVTSIELLKITTNNPLFCISNDRNRVKLESRKKLLLTCATIEAPATITTFNVANVFREDFKAPYFLLDQRPELKYVMNCLSLLENFHFLFVQQIRHLNIAGIFAKTDDHRIFHIEVLDTSNTLNDRTTPIGIMMLKLRLLEKMGCKVLLMDSRQSSPKITSLIKEFICKI